MRAVSGFLILAATLALSPQQAPPQAQKPPTQTPIFKAATDIISTNVVVRNASGRFIPDLTIKDFQVYEDGVRQEITAFARSVGGRVMSDFVSNKTIVPEGVVLPPRQAPDESGRIFIIFIDDLHLQPLDTPAVKQVLMRIRDTLLHDNDLVGLVSSGYSSISFDLSPDPKRIRFNQAIEKTQGSGKTPQEIINSLQTVEGPAGLRADAFTAFKTAYEILEQCERVTNRRKAFIWVSSGYDFNPFTDSRYQAAQDLYARPRPVQPGGDQANATQPTGVVRNPFEMNGLQFSNADLASALGELVRRARRANVVFYPIDPRGLVAGAPITAPVSQNEWATHDAIAHMSLDVMAAETGGRAVTRTNDFKTALQSIDNEMSDYYMIGYESNNPDPLQVRRRIEIKVTRPGAQKPIYNDWYSIKR